MISLSIFWTYYSSHLYMMIRMYYDTILPPQVIIALPAVLPPSQVLSLSPMFDSRDSFSFEKISSPKDTETPISPSSSVGSSSPVRSTTPPPDYLFNESIFAELDNSLWITSRPLGSEPVPEESNMPPKKTSISAAPTMTEAAIRQLITDGIIVALEARTANIANIDNTNKNTSTSGTPVARKGTNDHK
ncbi:hypothetical protein Tco_1103771 [Tanacetum coccineum]